MRIASLLAALWTVGALALSAQAAPTVVPYLGYVTTTNGAAFEGTVDVEVEIFSAQMGGMSLWGPHLYQDVAIDGGHLSILLGGGSSPDLAPALDSGQPLWLSFTVDSAALSPRQEILTVPFARRAELAANASQLGGQAAAAYARTADLPDAALSGSFNDLTDVPTGLAGSGTAGTVAQFSASAGLSDSVITQSGTQVGVNVALPNSALHVGGGLTIGNDTRDCGVAPAGTLRWNGSTLEVCDGSSWGGLGSGAASSISASGGNVTQFVGDGTNGTNGTTYRVHTFTSTDTLTVSNAGSSGSVEYLLVGGGGGGGACYGAGGGAGGFVEGNLNVAPGIYTITVGAGGGTNTNGNGGTGGASSIGVTGSTLVSALGGGFGGGSCANNGGGGGSGGGGSNGGVGAAGTPGQGFGGGNGTLSQSGGGGGGAASAGAGRAPGNGLASDINGTSNFYAGGGGGGSCVVSPGTADVPGGTGGGGPGGMLNAGQGDATANTGGGGGGTCATSCPAGPCRSGAGGSGIVIVRYPIGP